MSFCSRKLPRYNKLSDLGADLMSVSATQANIFALWPAYCWEAKQDD